MLAEAALNLKPGIFPFQSRFVSLDAANGGSKLHYIDEGSGPVVLMLHGNPTWSFLYRKQIAALRDRFRCIALDLPGFGLSEFAAGFSFLPEDHTTLVARFLERLDLRDATLVAHDWGGPIGLGARATAPHRITRIILGNTWAWPIAGDRHFEWFSAIMGGPPGRFGLRFNFFVNGFMPRAMKRGALAPEVRRGYQAPFDDPSRRLGTYVFPRAIVHSAAFLGGLPATLADLDPDRVLFVWPENDVAFRERELTRWLTVFPGASVVKIPNCGHFLWEEAADETIAAIEGWLPRNAGVTNASS